MPRVAKLGSVALAAIPVLALGTGSAVAATASPTSLSFSNRNIGEPSEVKMVTISTSASVCGDPPGCTFFIPEMFFIPSPVASGDFAVTSETCPASMSFPETCTASVQFSPTAAGLRTGTLSTGGSAAGPGQTVALSGTGVDPNAPPGGGGGGSSDTQAPTASFASHPKKKTKARRATFQLVADEQATFECALDKRDFTGCETLVTFRKLKRRRHTLRVRATDQAGNVGPEATFSWRVKK